MSVRKARLVWLVLGLLPVLLLPVSGVSHETGEPATARESDVPDEEKEPFELIMAYTDVTVGPGQEFEMDAEVVNPRKATVQVAIDVGSAPEGWTAGFHSRYPSYPVKGIMVQGEKSTTLELKVKLPDDVEPGNSKWR